MGSGGASMTVLFISHSSRDRPLAHRLRDRLRAKGYGALFLDSDERDGIAAGRTWQREIYTALLRSDAVLFLASESSVASQWCFAELALARSMGTPVFPLRASSRATLSLLDDVQWIDLAEGEPAYQRLWCGLERADLAAVDALAWDPTRSPYPGLRAFSAEDAGVFFGRAEEIRRLTSMVQPILARGGRWVSIVGPSGSGKSSLLHAGLLPRLQRMQRDWVVVPPFVPGTQPTRRLAIALARAHEAAGHERTVADLQAALAAPSSGATALVDAVGELSEVGGTAPARVLLPIDQAEELVTRTAPLEQQNFLQLLDRSIGDHSPMWVVCTLRSEFLSTAPERAGLSEVTDDALVLEPLSRSRLSEVIARPAKRAGLRFEAGLVERMVEETTGGDALPLLGHTLYELARMAGEGGIVRHEEYELVGGVVGALQRRADQVLKELTTRGYGPDTLPLMLKLVTVDGDGRFVRRRMRRAQLSEREVTIVEHFVEARLMTSDGGDVDPHRTDGRPSATVEVTHEALLRQWAPLRQAIADAEAGLRMRAELEHEAADWLHAGRTEAYLLRAGRVAAFDEWINLEEVLLSEEELAFLEASRDLATAELRAVLRSNRRLRTLLGGVAALMVVAIVASVVALYMSREATREAVTAITRQLLAEASTLRASQPDVASLLGVEALERAPDNLRDEARVSLFRTLNRPLHVTLFTRPQGEAIRSVAFSRDGRLIATAGDDRAVTLWTATGQRLRQLLGHTEPINCVTFSPDGRLLASSGLDDTIRLWGVSGGRPDAVRVVRGHRGPVSAIAFSPDGATLASASDDGTVRLWDVAAGRQLGEPLADEGSNARFWRVAFSPDGTRLAATASDGTLRLWNPKTRQGVRPREPVHESANGLGAIGVAFNRSGTRLATSGGDGTVKIWNVATGRQVGPTLTGHVGEVTAVGFNRDSSLLASAGRDGSVRLWDASTMQLHSELDGHTNAVRSIAFNPDGTKLASVSYDGSLRVWQVAVTDPVGPALTGWHGQIIAVAVDTHGGRLAAGGADGGIRIWDSRADVNSRPRVLTGHKGWVTSLAFDPQGMLLASAGGDHTVRLWDVGSGRQRGRSLPHAAEVSRVAFLDKGTRLVSTSRDGSLRFWDVATGALRAGPLQLGIGDLTALAVSSDGRWLAVAGSAGSVRVLDTASGRAMGEPLRGHSGWILDLAFRPGSALLASAGADGNVRLWDAAHGTPKDDRLSGHMHEVNAVSFTPDGNYLASTSKDHTVRLWQPDTGQQIGESLSTGGDAYAAWASYDTRSSVLWVAIGDTLRRWDFAPDTLIQAACSTARRSLNRLEWGRWIGFSQAYRETCPAEGHS
jgi:WD40 repeat protein